MDGKIFVNIYVEKEEEELEQVIPSIPSLSQCLA